MMKYGNMAKVNERMLHWTDNETEKKGNNIGNNLLNPHLQGCLLLMATVCSGPRRPSFSCICGQNHCIFRLSSVSGTFWLQISHIIHCDLLN